MTELWPWPCVVFLACVHLALFLLDTTFITAQTAQFTRIRVISFFHRTIIDWNNSSLMLKLLCAFIYCAKTVEALSVDTLEERVHLKLQARVLANRSQGSISVIL